MSYSKIFCLLTFCLMPTTQSFYFHSKVKLFYPSLLKLNAIPRSNKIEVVTDLDRITSSWTLKQYGQNSAFILECIDRTLDEDIVSVNISRIGGLGIDLVELASIPNSKNGLVAINDIIPGSNADKSGLLSVGDVLVSISEPAQSSSVSMRNSNMKSSSLEALNFDTTINEISKFSEYSEITLTIRRLIKRKSIAIELYDPEGKFTGLNFTVLSGYKGALRTALLNNDIKMYDTRTARLDSPYQTGDCGGEGTCCTWSVV